MAKGKKSIFFCQNCGHEESKWLGQCPMCKEWNTFVEEKVSVTRGSTAAVQQVNAHSWVFKVFKNGYSR